MTGPLNPDAAPTGPSIVLVDDAAELRSMLRRLLERVGGFSVVGECSDALAAERLIVESEPDLVLLDLAMPGGGVLELIARLRSTLPALSIVVLSGYPVASTGARCLEQGADRYIEKGTPVAELCQLLRSALEERGRS